MVDVEEYFPRGGKKPTTTQFVQSSNFLRTTEKKERKKKQRKRSEDDDGYLSEEADQDVDKSYKTCGLWLSYKVMKEDFLMLGRVSQVKEMKILISLPSRLMGTVMACHISESYNKVLEAYIADKVDKVNELSQMFKRGQYVCVKVLEVQNQQVMLTMMPQHVNSIRKKSDLHKGAILHVAVSSVEDHGYIMETGIPNTTAFLPKKSVNLDIKLDVGMITMCSIKSIQSSGDNSVLTLSNETAALQNAFQRTPTTQLAPGTAIDFVVNKPLDNGIEGLIFGEKVGYIQRHHIDTNKGKKPALGARIRARLLYTLSATNIPYFTTRDIFDPTCIDLNKEQHYNDGDIVEDAQVMKILGRAMYFKLSAGYTGILSIRRLQVHENLTDEEILAKSYPIGSTHRVRILGYHLLDRVYSVTDQADILREKYFTLSQLSVGEQVTATVNTVTDTYLKATVGRIQAFIPQIHMTDSGIFIDLKKATTSKLSKKKFKEGQEVKGRVLYLDHSKNNAVLTLKPTLLSPDTSLLLSFDDAVVGKAYTGIITFMRDYLLVSFFNNVKSLIPRKFVSREPLENLTDSFHLGQLVTCVIMNINTEEEKIVASLTHEPFERTMNANKRKYEKDESEEVSEKGTKKRNKNKDNETDHEVVEEGSFENIKENKKKKKDKMLKQVEERNSIALHSTNINNDIHEIEESDAMDTDITENKCPVLNPREMSLLDISECKTNEDFKARISQLLKAVNSKVRYLDKIENNIQNIELKGLSPKNKKNHTQLHINRLTIQEHVTQLLDTVKLAQEKLRELDDLEEDAANIERPKIKTKEEKVKNKEEKLDNRNKIKDVKVLDKLEPVIDVPSAKDFWSVDSQVVESKQEDESSSSEDEEQEKPKKKRKKLTAAEKVAKARDEEERVREMEKRAIESENEPRSVEQFQRALLASPDCSQLWIAYMAFHLQATEIERARGVARKGISTINFREEQERLNVWLALLNLEHRFGNKETQQKTLEEALQMNDTYQVHRKLLEILLDTSKHQELVQLVELMQRKYRQQLEMYTACGAACYKAGLLDKARQLMQKGISALEKKQHVALLVQFAQLERATGERERAEALFEQVLAVYPARVDVCCHFVDMLMKTGDITRIRQVLERMTAHKLPARKMKVLFRKWIEVEEKYGDQAEQIRQKALEYVDNAKF